jgi:hypothetical protein
VLLDAIERRIVTVRHSSDEAAAPNSAFGGNVSHYFADIPLGMYIVRGDSLVVAGEVHNPDEGIDAHAQLSSSYPTPGMQRVSLEELQKLSTSKDAEPPIEWDFDGDLIA